MAAEKVPRPKIPLPHDNFFSGSNSGSIPYFVGPKMALCVLIRKMPASIRRMLARHRPMVTTDMMPEFGAFDGDGDAALAEAVGEKSTGHGKQNKRQSEDDADQRHEAVAFFHRKAHADDEEGDEQSEDVVAEGILEFDDKHEPEAAKFVWLARSGAWVFGFHDGATLNYPARKCELKNFPATSIQPMLRIPGRPLQFALAEVWAASHCQSDSSRGSEISPTSFRER